MEIEKASENIKANQKLTQQLKPAEPIYTKWRLLKKAQNAGMPLLSGTSISRDS